MNISVTLNKSSYDKYKVKNACFALMLKTDSQDISLGLISIGLHELAISAIKAPLIFDLAVENGTLKDGVVTIKVMSYFAKDR